jgi:hypothetical protein
MFRGLWAGIEVVVTEIVVVEVVVLVEVVADGDEVVVVTVGNGTINCEPP